MNYFDKIRNLNNLQLCHFLNEIGGELQLVALALDKASNPDIYCSNDNFCISTPDKGNTNAYDSTVYWHRCLSKDFDESMEKIFKNDTQLRDQMRGWLNQNKNDTKGE